MAARKDVRRCLEEQAIALLSSASSHVLMLHQVQGHHNSPFSISNSDLFSPQPKNYIHYCRPPISKKLVSNRVRLLILTRQIYFTTSPPFSCFQGNFPAHIFKLGWDSLVHICSRGPIRKFPEFHERLLETNLQCWSAFVLLYASKEEETLSFERVTSSLFQPGFFNVLVCILFYSHLCTFWYML